MDKMKADNIKALGAYTRLKDQSELFAEHATVAVRNEDLIAVINYLEELNMRLKEKEV